MNLHLVYHSMLASDQVFSCTPIEMEIDLDMSFMIQDCLILKHARASQNHLRKMADVMI